MRFQRPPFQHKPFQHRDRREEEPDSERSSGQEAEYLRRLTEEKTPVVIHMRTGESFRGFIEYYDKRFVRLTRADAPNLFIFKHDIKYLFEE